MPENPVTVDPCPTCQAEQTEFDFEIVFHNVVCQSCGHLGPRGQTAQEAVDLWNAE